VFRSDFLSSGVRDGGFFENFDAVFAEKYLQFWALFCRIVIQNVGAISDFREFRLMADFSAIFFVFWPDLRNF